MPTTSNVLCGCGRFMRVKKNSVTVEELDEQQDGYKLWSADLFECEECGTEIISGFAREPLAEHYHIDYRAIRERRLPIYPGRCAPVPDKEEPRDEAYARATARYDGNGKDWR